ncbi:MAG: hypothetical protein FJW39_09690 [Acidobacteria bacterium]|nr:hypothetical protein [Acidobacteriota bacterium]
MKNIVCILLAAASAHAAWKTGAAAVNITPKESIWMAGYAARTKPSEGVLQDIWAKALAIEDESGARSVVVTLDLVGIRKRMADDLAETVKSRHGIPRERLWFNASHTHSAPLVGDSDTYDLGTYSEAQAPVLNRYRAFVAESILAAISKSLGKLEASTLHFEQGLAGFAVNRRRVGHREYPGPVDHDVPVLAAKNTQGVVTAVLFGYACHNTVLSDYVINGDYAGFAQEAIEQRFPGAVALFVQGGGADANPLPRRSVDLAKRYGVTLADAVTDVVKGKMKPVAGPLKAAFEFAEIQFAGPVSKQEWERRAAGNSAQEKRHAARMLGIIEREGKLRETYPYPVQAWRFGSGPMIVTLGGELVVDYSLKIKGKFGWDTTWVAGYSNDVFAYIPSVRVLREGGYEGGGAMLFGSLPGPFAEDVEQRIGAAVDRVAGAVR